MVDAMGAHLQEELVDIGGDDPKLDGEAYVDLEKVYRKRLEIALLSFELERVELPDGEESHLQIDDIKSLAGVLFTNCRTQAKPGPVIEDSSATRIFEGTTWEILSLKEGGDSQFYGFRNSQTGTLLRPIASSNGCWACFLPNEDLPKVTLEIGKEDHEAALAWALTCEAS